MGEWIDITASLSSATPSYPGDPAFSLSWLKRIGVNGRRSNLSALSLGAHAGTHIDAPFHFLKSGSTVEKIDPNALMGPCQVIELKHDQDVSKRDLEGWSGIPRVLFKTANSRRRLMSRRKFTKNYAAVTLEAADLLKRRGLRLVGIDYLSIEKFAVVQPVVHWEFLKKKIVIVEGLVLSGVKPGFYDLVCLPLRIQGGEGSPARAFLKNK